MIKKVDMFKVICDRCGADAFADEEYSCWSDEDIARDWASQDDDWQVIDDKDYCPKCYLFDPETDEYVVKPEAKEFETLDGASYVAGLSDGIAAPIELDERFIALRAEYDLAVASANEYNIKWGEAKARIAELEAVLDPVVDGRNTDWD